MITEIASSEHHIWESQAARLGQDEYDAMIGVVRFVGSDLHDGSIEAKAAEVGLAVYASWLGDTTKLKADADGAAFVAEMFKKLAYGSKQWQIWAAPNQWDVWYERHEADPNREAIDAEAFVKFTHERTRTAAALEAVALDSAVVTRMEQEAADAPEKRPAERAKQRAVEAAEEIAEAELSWKRYFPSTPAEAEAAERFWEAEANLVADFQAVVGDDSVLREAIAADEVFRAVVAARPAASASKTPRSDAFAILTRAELRALPPISWLIDGLVQTHGIVILGGDGGVGKTAVALGMAGCVAAGTDWHGRPVKQGNVLYIAGEGVEGIDARLQAWESVYGISVPDDRMQYVSDGFSLSSQPAVDYARSVVADRDYSLVILDTLSQLSSLESENDNAELAKVINRARAIRQARPGATVIIVHHTSKEGRLRGASVLRNNSDAVIIARTETSSNGFYLSTDPSVDGKQKNGPSEKLDAFWLDQVRGSVVVRRGGRDPIVRAIANTVADGAEHAGAEFYFVCEAHTDAKRKGVLRALSRLVDEGALIHNGASTTAARWRRA